MLTYRIYGIYTVSCVVWRMYEWMNDVNVEIKRRNKNEWISDCDCMVCEWVGNRVLFWMN